MPDRTPLIKEAGELKEAHESRLAVLAPPIFDVDRTSRISGDRSCPPTGAASRTMSSRPMSAWRAASSRRHVRDARLQRARAADPRVPPRQVRRLHGLRQCLPRHAPSWPSPSRSPTSSRGSTPSRRPSRSRPLAADHARAHFAPTTEVRRRPGAQGRPEPAAFGIFVDPVHCKGCAECVEVCTPSATTRCCMIDKVADEPEPARVDARALRARHALLPLAAADAGRVPQREGAGRPDARRARHRLRRRRRLVRRLRRGDRDPHAGRRDAPGPRPRVDGHRRGDRLQHGLRQHLPVQPVPRAVDQLAVRERARRWRSGIRARWDQAGHPDRRLWVIGGDGAMYDIGFQALSRMVASGADIKVLVLDTQVYSNTGGQASTASLRRPGHQAVGVRQRAPRPAGAAQGARPDPDGPRRRVRRPDHAGAHQPLLPGRHGGERLPGPGRGHRLHACHARARHRRRRRDAPGEARRRLARLPAVHLRPAPRRDDRRAPVAPGQSRPCARTGQRCPTARRSTS